VGGLLFELTARPAARCADLSPGIFPFLSALANPHWLVGTWLLLESGAAVSRAASRADILRGLLLAMVLGLSRPYDMVLLVLVQVAAVLIRRPAGEWARSLLPLTGLLPVVAYLYWVFFAIARFRGFSGVYYHPPPLDLLLALGPALALAIWAVRSGGGSAAPEMRLRLWLWTALGVLVTASGAVRFSLQFGVGAGLPLLMLGAWGLPRLGRRGGPVLVAAFATTAVVALRIVMAADPHWFVAAERRQAVLALREQCRAGDVVMGPEDLGLQMLSLTACRPFLAHPVSPDYESRKAAVTAFYTSLPASERRRLLEIARVRHVLLPGRLPPEPTPWLGAGSGFERTASVGEGEAAIGIYSRVP
jgi:hypothetical protein